MLSNPQLASCGLFDILRVKSLVIDEASQVDVCEFMVRPVLALWTISDTKSTKTSTYFTNSPKTSPKYVSSETLSNASPRLHTCFRFISSYVSPALWLGGSWSPNNFRHQATEKESEFP